jgi:fermentation-respiration switch protein FrsA (DUF1100 family)
MTQSSKEDILDQPAKKPAKIVKRKRRRAPRSWPARIVISLLRIAFFGYVAVLVALLLMEERLIYPAAYQADETGITVSQPGDPVQTISIPSTGDVTVPARLVDRPGADRVVLFFHGNAEKAKWLDNSLLSYADACNASVMAAEYRGYEDDATPTEKGVIEDCLAARDYLCQHYRIQPTDIILHGRSLGGGSAVAVASRGGARALILEKTFDRAYAVAAQHYWWIPFELLMRNRYDSLAKLTVYEGPLLQIHGEADQMIPIEHAQRLFDSADCTPKEFISVPGMGHNDPLPNNVKEQIFDWVRALPPNQIDAASHLESLQIDPPATD